MSLTLLPNLITQRTPPARVLPSRKVSKLGISFWLFFGVISLLRFVMIATVHLPYLAGNTQRPCFV